jgi:hypothetical protein
VIRCSGAIRTTCMHRAKCGETVGVYGDLEERDAGTRISAQHSATGKPDCSAEVKRAKILKRRFMGLVLARCTACLRTAVRPIWPHIFHFIPSIYRIFVCKLLIYRSSTWITSDEAESGSGLGFGVQVGLRNAPPFQPSPTGFAPRRDSNKL